MLALRNPGDVLANVRSALGPLKAALDERDNWEMLAAADEAKQVSQMTASSAKQSSLSPTPRNKLSGIRSRKGTRGTAVTAGTLLTPKIPRNFDKQIYFHYGLNTTTITSSTTTSSILTINTTGGGDPNYTQNSAIFDCFWILKLRVTFQNNQPPGSLVQTPSVYMAPEFEGITPANITILRGYNSLRKRLLPSGRTFSYSVAPRFQDALALGSASDVGWLTATTASGTAVWNGIAVGLDVQNTATTYPIQIEIWTAWSNGN